MRWATLWSILAVLAARSLAQFATPTACEDESCRCDAFTRVICNCTKDYDEVTLRPDGAYRVPSTTTGIVIDGCARVYFLPDMARNLIQLRNIELRNVRHVYIHDRALAWSPFSSESDMNPGIRIFIHNSTINEISSHAIQGRVNDIIISKCKINVIKPYAFSSLTGVKSVQLIDNLYENIETQAFKKFSTVNFLFRGGSVGTLPSRFMSDVEVSDLFRIDSVSIRYVYSLSFIVNSPKKVIIENNVIDTLEGDSFHMNARGPITFRNNSVRTLRKGAFLGLTADIDIVSVMGLQELVIDNNTFTELTPSSLTYNRTSLTMRIDGLNLNTTCGCELQKEWGAVMREQGGTLSCWYSLEEHFASIPTYVNTRCGTYKQIYWIFIVVGVILIVLLAGIITFCIVKKENEKKKKMQMIMPDGKTYRETEFHIVVERAELLTTDL
ncbi:uncharacterized protein LOC125241750 [Leguminivora glycinivorella]|uniref:uncharacterized protein LOC125241750 n=1 Tax=Leguminivora glycinivorella TaxID=1035111 RepID=UPI0020107825|nr:uncharacterized protein LOC125241750 [Leguminivora glycinivorella]XP_048006322.1 uncharacterized protein LOC125241750 [Leguminivora glycinivorella]